jgi:homocysteine S-methyltransferase
VSGCIGPRGDGYDPGKLMTPDEAAAYHAGQIGWLDEAGADMIAAVTITNIPEAIGIARAAKERGAPLAMSFTLETDGRLPTGDAMGKAVETVDEATGGAPAYYMINCAHPTHFAGTLAEGGAWLKRLRGIRANASKRSHAELDAAPDLDDGNPAELGAEYRALLSQHGQITVLGGCCGTDHRHVEAISHACKHAA